MSTADGGAQSSDGGRPYRQARPVLRVFRDGDPPPPADVLALMDHKGGYWPRFGLTHWLCPGSDPHTWHEMSSAGPFIEAPLIPDGAAVTAAIAADDARRQRSGDRKDQQ